jgi:hypothetical protein
LSAGFVLRMSKWVSGMGVSPFGLWGYFPGIYPLFDAKQCDGMHHYERCKSRNVLNLRGKSDVM